MDLTSGSALPFDIQCAHDSNSMSLKSQQTEFWEFDMRIHAIPRIDVIHSSQTTVAPTVEWVSRWRYIVLWCIEIQNRSFQEFFCDGPWSPESIYILSHCQCLGLWTLNEVNKAKADKHGISWWHNWNWYSKKYLNVEDSAIEFLYYLPIWIGFEFLIAVPGIVDKIRCVRSVLNISWAQGN